MPHRDPDTGQFVADGDGDHGLSYSDHDVHHIAHRFNVRPGNDNPDDLTNVQRYEITQRGLDPDEIAELRAMRVSATAFYQHDGTEIGPGTLTVNIDSGYNLAEGEFVRFDSNELLDPDGDGTDEYASGQGETDEVGQLYQQQVNIVLPKDDETNGVGTGPALPHVTEHLPLSEMFGSGPFVDSADDFTSGIAINANRVSGGCGVDVRYSLYYNVMQVEGGRSRFGR